MVMGIKLVYHGVELDRRTELTMDWRALGLTNDPIGSRGSRERR